MYNPLSLWAKNVNTTELFIVYLGTQQKRMPTLHCEGKALIESGLFVVKKSLEIHKQHHACKHQPLVFALNNRKQTGPIPMYCTGMHCKWNFTPDSKITAWCICTARSPLDYFPLYYTGIEHACRCTPDPKIIARHTAIVINVADSCILINIEHSFKYLGM